MLAHGQGQPWELWGQIWASSLTSWTVQSQTPVLQPGTVTLQIDTTSPPVVAGGPEIQPLATDAPLLVDPGPNQEIATPSAVRCAWTAGACSITITLIRSHPQAPYALRSASAGLQEAIDMLKPSGGTVRLDVRWPGTTAMIAAAQGSSVVQVVRDGPGTQTWYGWSGSSYVSTLALNTPAGAVDSSSFEDIHFADQFAGGNPGAQIDAAAAFPGMVWVPATLGAGIPSSASALEQVSILDLRTGTSANPEANRTFDFPQWFSRVWDASPDSASAEAQGNAHFLPIWRQDTIKTGSGVPINAYLSLSNRSYLAAHALDATNPASLFTYSDISYGGRDSGVWGYNAVVAADGGWPVLSATRSVGTVTLTTGALSWGGSSYHVGGSYAGGAPIRAGDQIMVEGVADPSFDGGLFTVTAVALDSISYAQAGSEATSSGGTATLDANLFGAEFNIFNSIGDSGGPLPQTTRAKWGLAVTNSGEFPISAAYLATFAAASNSESAVGDRPHIGYLVEDALDSGFRCGDITATAPAPNGPLLEQSCVSASARAQATSGMNFGSVPYEAESSYWNGSGASSYAGTLAVEPGAGANPGERWAWSLNGTEVGSINSGGVITAEAIDAAGAASSLFSGTTISDGTNGMTIAQEGGATLWRDSNAGCADCWLLQVPPLQTSHVVAQVFGGANIGADPTLQVHGTLTADAVANQCSGVTAAMTAGTVTISNACLTGTRPIMLVEATKGGTQGILSYVVTAGTLVISSSSASDASTVSWVQN